MKRVKLPEEDTEKSGKGCHPRRETGVRPRAGAGAGEGGENPVSPGPQPSFLARPSAGGSGRENEEGGSWKDLACGLDINVTEGELGGGRGGRTIKIL